MIVHIKAIFSSIKKRCKSLIKELKKSVLFVFLKKLGNHFSVSIPTSVCLSYLTPCTYLIERVCKSPNICLF